MHSGSFKKNSSFGLENERIDNTIKNQQPISKQQKSPRHHQPVGPSEVDELFAARDRLREFAEQVGELKITGIRRDAFQNCDKVKILTVNQLSYDNIQKIVKNRIQKMIKNKRIKKNWSEEDVKILIWVVSKYSDFRNIDNICKELDSADWDFIASLIPGVQGENCMFKWLSLKKNNLSDNSWSERQSTLLNKIVRKHGEKDWALVSQKLYYLNTSLHKIYRCPKQCRQHWNCYLNPQLKKGPWSKEEDLLLLNCIKKNNGLKRWAEMISLFNGRTENALKNRFTLIMEKQIRIHVHEKRQLTELDLIQKYLERSYVEQFVTIDGQEKQDQNAQKSITKLKTQDSKKQIKILLRKRGRVTSPKKSENFESQQIKIQEVSIEQHSIFQPNSQFPDHCHFSPLRDVQLSQPQAMFFPNEENKIFEEDSMPLYCTSSKTEEEMPNLEKIKIVQLDKKNLQNLKTSLLQNNSQFFPCKIVENKLTKINL